MHFVLRHKRDHLDVDVRTQGRIHRVVVDGIESVVEVRRRDAAGLVLAVDGHQYRIDLLRAGRTRTVAVRGEVHTFTPETGMPADHAVGVIATPNVTAPMPGKVLQVHVKAGDAVAGGDPLLILEAMKMETRLAAEADGIVDQVHVAAGDMVDGGQLLIVLRYGLGAET
jgi:biotin carboxyl carrier protein